VRTLVTKNGFGHYEFQLIGFWF